MQTELSPVQSIYIPICISNVLKQQLKVLRAGPAHTGIFYLNFTGITVRGLHIFQKLCSISAIQTFCSPILPEGAPEAHPCLPAGLTQGASARPGVPTQLPQVLWNRALLPLLQHPSLSCCGPKDCIGKARLRAAKSRAHFLYLVMAQLGAEAYISPPRFITVLFSLFPGRRRELRDFCCARGRTGRDLLAPLKYWD